MPNSNGSNKDITSTINTEHAAASSRTSSSPLAPSATQIAEFLAAMTHRDLIKAEQLIQENEALKDAIVDSDNNQSALHWAIQLNLPELVKSLLAHGADVTHQDCLGRTPLHTAIMKKSPSKEILKLLVIATQEQDGLNIPDREGRTPLSLAAISGCTKAIKYLLGHGADITYQDYLGRIPLHLSIYQRELKLETTVFEHLVTATKAKGWLEAKDAQGRTPLDWAILMRNNEAYQWLLKAGANPYTDLDQIPPERINMLLASGIPVINRPGVPPELVEALIARKTILAQRQVDISKAAGFSLHHSLLLATGPLIQRDLAALDTIAPPVEGQPPYINAFGTDWLEEALNHWQTHERLQVSYAHLPAILAIQAKDRTNEHVQKLSTGLKAVLAIPMENRTDDHLANIPEIESLVLALPTRHRTDENLQGILHGLDTLLTLKQVDDRTDVNICARIQFDLAQAAKDFERAVAHLAEIPTPKQEIFRYHLQHLEKQLVGQEQAAVKALYQALEEKHSLTQTLARKPALFAQTSVLTSAQLANSEPCLTAPGDNPNIVSL